MTEQEAIDKLNAMGREDIEGAHWDADEILLKFLEANGFPKVAMAWRVASSRVGFWYA